MPELLTDPTADRWSKLSVKSGRNTWRVLVARQFGPRAKALHLAATGTAKLLQQIQPSTWIWYNWLGSWSPNAIASGDARPIIPVDVKFGSDVNVMPLERGEVLGTRRTFLPHPDDTLPEYVDLVRPTGGFPCWIAYVDFWWRGPDREFETFPFVGEGLEQWVCLDLAKKPLDERDPGDPSLADQIASKGGEIIETAISDWEKTATQAMRAVTSRGTAFVAGGVLALFGVAYLMSKRGGAR